MEKLWHRIIGYYFDFKKHNQDLFPENSKHYISPKEMVLKMSIFITLSENPAKGFWDHFAYLPEDINNNHFNTYNQLKVKIDAKNRTHSVWVFAMYLVWCEEKPLQKTYEYNPNKFAKVINIEENRQRKLRKEYEEKQKKAA